MSLNKRNIFFSLIALFFLWGCKEVFDAQYISPTTGYLVVEGFINSGTGPTTIKLSRTIKLSDKTVLKAENSAKIFVESDKNDRNTLVQTEPGTYATSGIALNPVNKYRINITTSDGKNYVSAFSSVRFTPPIDSISWERKNEDDGLQLYINAHNDAGNTRYYQWKYDETWEIRSSFVSSLKYTIPPNKLQAIYRFGDHTYDTTIIRCWQFFKARDISVGSTESLTKDVLYAPITYIPPKSIKLGVLYSIETRMYSLSPEAYRFTLQMKKNTQQLGSIFDAQPSEMNTNITCTSSPSDIVIGFVEVTQEQVKRIFLDYNKVGKWKYYPSCDYLEIDNIEDSINAHSSGKLPTEPTKFNDSGGSIIKFMAATSTCVDCTLSGINKKPAYWPY